MKRFVVLAALCLVPSLVWAAPRKRAKVENYGTMRIQAEVFKRLIRHTLPLNAESPVFLSVYLPEDSVGAFSSRAIDPNLRVKRWAGHERYTEMQSTDAIYRRRLANKYHADRSASYGGTYLIITAVNWITPRDVEVEATILGKDWSENDYTSGEFYRYKLCKRSNRWRAVSEKVIGVAG